jgi:hypothetical protein
MKDTKAEVEYKQKSGTAWSHSYLNQKPWHPLSYPNQRRKWIAEQQTAQKDRKADEVAREVLDPMCLPFLYSSLAISVCSLLRPHYWGMLDALGCPCCSCGSISTIEVPDVKKNR